MNENTIEITELPIRTWTQTYKESVLEPMLEGSSDKPAMITDFREYHTEETVKFVVKMKPEQLNRYEREGLHKVFKLQVGSFSRVYSLNPNVSDRYQHFIDGSVRRRWMLAQI